MRITVLIAALFASAVISGCSSDPEPPPVSKGKQLTDLQGAYQNRAITDDEYEEQKEEILDQ